MALLSRSRPTAIGRLIIAVVVNTVNGVPLWARSHIGKERLERRAPSLTHADPTAAITMKPVMGWVVTASLHRQPRDICAAWSASRLLSVYRSRFMSVPIIAFYEESPSETAATACIARPQRRPCDDTRRSALTIAKPEKITTLLPCERFYEQLAERLADQVQRLAAFCTPTMPRMATFKIPAFDNALSLAVADTTPIRPCASTMAGSVHWRLMVKPLDYQTPYAFTSPVSLNHS